jgi:hypothetical protein
MNGALTNQLTDDELQRMFLQLISSMEKITATRVGFDPCGSGRWAKLSHLVSARYLFDLAPTPRCRGTEPCKAHNCIPPGGCR